MTVPTPAASPQVPAKSRLRHFWAAVHPPLRAELPLVVIQVSLLVVLLHANAPEVWFWFLVLEKAFRVVPEGFSFLTQSRSYLRLKNGDCEISNTSINKTYKSLLIII